MILLHRNLRGDVGKDGFTLVEIVLGRNSFWDLWFSRKDPFQKMVKCLRGILPFGTGDVACM
jgi:hypothetical protein